MTSSAGRASAGWSAAGAVDSEPVVDAPWLERLVQYAAVAGALLLLRALSAALEASLVAVGLPRAQALAAAPGAGRRERALAALCADAEGTALVRVMPNTPAMVGEGMAIVSAGSSATPEQAEMVRGLFALLGDAVVLDERYQNAGAALSGSGPAYFALVIDALSRARRHLLDGPGQTFGVTRQELVGSLTSAFASCFGSHRPLGSLAKAEGPREIRDRASGDRA